VRELLPNADHEKENREVERREIADLEGVIPLPGTRELLYSLPAERWTIVTSSTRALAEVRIRAAGLLQPKHLITSSDVKHGKPHPEPYLNAAKALGYSATDCIVVEDAPAGIRAGTAAGARVIAFPTTTSVPELRSAEATWVLNNCSSIRCIKNERSSRMLQLQLDQFRD
jgi:sugar-phosphatase